MHRRQKFLESKGHALHVAASNLGLAVPTSTAIAPASASALPAAARYTNVCLLRWHATVQALTCHVCAAVWRRRATSPPRSPMRRRERQRRKGDRDAAYDGDYERDTAIDFPPPANKIERFTLPATLSFLLALTPHARWLRVIWVRCGAWCVALETDRKRRL